jgi:hypothetical protein
MKCFPHLSLFVFHNPRTLLVHLYLLAKPRDLSFLQDADRLGYVRTSFQVTVQSDQTDTQPDIQLAYGRVKISRCSVTTTTCSATTLRVTNIAVQVGKFQDLAIWSFTSCRMYVSYPFLRGLIDFTESVEVAIEIKPCLHECRIPFLKIVANQ